MKPVPFILLLASVLLASHGRPSVVRTLPARDEALLGAVSDLLGDTLLRVIQRTSPGTELRAPGMEGEPEKNRVDDLGGLSKRSEEPPISIDLTFHMLRHMIHMARVEREKEQAEMNRHFLDEVGK
ncbi:unnamed protein product [Boreogadus saida]